MKRRIIGIGIAAAFLTILSPVRAAHEKSQLTLQKGKATAVVTGENPNADRIEVRLSGTVEVVFRVQGNDNLQVEPIKTTKTSDGWVVRAETPPTFVAQVWEQKFTMEPPGPDGIVKLTLPPLRYRDSQADHWETVQWDTVPVRVTTEIIYKDPSKELRDLHVGVEDLPAQPSSSSWLLWVGLGFVALGLLYGVWELRRRFSTPPPEPPPHQWALGELKRLEKMNLPATGQAERYPTLLSDVVRSYLERRFQLQAQRQTTAEFLDGVRGTDHLNPAQLDRLREFLERCDLAKFAQVIPAAEECKTLGEMARQLVQETVPPSTSS
jgi:hypothetical protein